MILHSYGEHLTLNSWRHETKSKWPWIAFPVGNVFIWDTILSIFLMYHTSSLGPPEQLKSASVISTNYSCCYYTFASRPNVECSTYDSYFELLCIKMHKSLWFLERKTKNKTNKHKIYFSTSDNNMGVFLVSQSDKMLP